MAKKRILIIGPNPTSGVGGVRTHVRQILTLLKSNSLKVIKTTPTIETFRVFFKFKPNVVIHNLSVYPRELVKVIINRSIMLSAFSKHILHLHGGRFDELGFLSNPIFKKFLAFHFQRYDIIFCLTEEQYATMSAFAKKKTVRKIFNYVEIPDNIKLAQENNMLNFLYMGRLTPKKGVMDAVEAITRIEKDGLRLWIVGDGELKDEISQIDDPRIKFVGKKIGEKKYKYLEMADIFVFPSSWPEGMPYAMLEASAYGLALIGTNIGAVDQILHDGINGFLIEAGNIDMLVDTIKKFLQQPDLASKMGNESYKICKNHFSIEHLKKIYDDLFAEWDKENLHNNRQF